MSNFSAEGVRLKRKTRSNSSRQIEKSAAVNNPSVRPTASCSIVPYSRALRMGSPLGQTCEHIGICLGVRCGRNAATLRHPGIVTPSESVLLPALGRVRVRVILLFARTRAVIIGTQKRNAPPRRGRPDPRALTCCIAAGEISFPVCTRPRPRIRFPAVEIAVK